MNVYAARQPIFDGKQELFAYELLYRRTEENFYQGTDDTESTANLINHAFLVMDLNDIISGKRAFINFSKELLVQRIPLLLPADQVVIEVLERVDPDETVVEACRELKEKGYLLALDDFVLREDYWSLMELADIIKVEYNAYSESGHRQLATLFSGKKMLVERVETRAEFEHAASLGYHYFQGYFFSKPVMLRGREIAPFNTSLLQVLEKLNDETPSYHEMAAIIEKDLSSSYKFLRLANTMQFGARYRVDSMEGALVRMGLGEIRKWIYLMLLNEVKMSENAEMIRTSIVRARMMELLAQKTASPSERLNYFLTGLFSLLDCILAKPFEQLVEELPLAKPVEEALMGKRSVLGDWLRCIDMFEKGNAAPDIKCHKGITMAHMMKLYVEAIRWESQVTASPDSD
ncbi:EAL and HDOD domain-containing protein [Anoxynatronum sibiricum]|uniref:HDOD domain-containing protein n=1 Tax=Anoxynatronum sibiricum TaxID=210623 RepID=A0ABU9VVP8_9CLOT